MKMLVQNMFYYNILWMIFSKYKILQYRGKPKLIAVAKADLLLSHKRKSSLKIIIKRPRVLLEGKGKKLKYLTVTVILLDREIKIGQQLLLYYSPTYHLPK